MHVIINNQKEKVKQLKNWVLEEIIPQDLKDKIRQLQKDHQLTITDRDNQVRAIQYENVVLQRERKIRAKD